MTIRLIKDEEQLTATLHGATFMYRRMPAHARAKIIDDYTSKRSGNVNWGKASIAMLQHCITGWSGVTDEQGKALDFEKALLAYIPDAISADLMELLGENAELDADIKNSKSSQPSKP